MAGDHAGTETMPAGHEPFEETVRLEDMQVMVTVDPAMPGPNTITLMFTPHPKELNEVSISASLPSEEVPPLDLAAEPDPAEPGAYVIEDASLSIAGEWELRVEALLGEFDLLTETIAVPIGEE
jgi:copper transport protein